MGQEQPDNRTEQERHIQDFLKACMANSVVPDHAPIKAKEAVNGAITQAELKQAYHMNDEDSIIYKNFWKDFFDMANYIGPINPLHDTTIACCCSCCL
jgi:hypothetical protein